MKQVAQNYRSGQLTLLDVPAPACRDGGVLVRSLYSLISTGTEMMKVHEAKLSLAGKARARPEQVRQVLDTVVQQGPVSTYKKVMTRLDSSTPLGYSVCGVVIDVGRGAEEFHVGQIVACAGNEHALHAEINWVPVNLCVAVPEGVASKEAAFATVGAIALHGVRRSEVQLGESACVVGLGLVGQLVVQLLIASGVSVVGLDTVRERCKLAEATGAIACDIPDAAGIDRIEHVLQNLGEGAGADHVLLAAGGASNGPVEAAARLARDRARVVDIGKCRLDLPWNVYYDKELDLRLSRSYGPGRYDRRYELEGADYPISYVRWTERRNLACFVDLLARGALSIGSLISGCYPIEDAVATYERLSSGTEPGVGFLFEYGQRGCHPDERRSQMSIVAPQPADSALPESATSSPLSVARLFRPDPSAGAVRRTATTRPVRIGFVGAGSYASSMLLPSLVRHPHVELRHVATTTPLTAHNAQARFGFAVASTGAEAVLEDDDVDAVFVVTRHRTHADLTCRALEAGKAVFVEKPLALSPEELTRVLDTVESTGNDRLMVGFNRRFAPLLVDLRARFGSPGTAAMVRYAVNAGRLGSRSWYADEQVEGPRFVGEGGHFIDTVSWWLGSRPIEVSAMAASGPSDLLCSIRFDDDSVASIAYATTGNPRYPKEVFDVSAGGRTARLDNFRRATLWSGRRRHFSRTYGSVDKGQRQELEAFVAALCSGEPMPIPLSSLVDTTVATFAAQRSLATGVPEAL